MPYIKQHMRDLIDIHKKDGCFHVAEHSGELNYMITVILKDYLGEYLNYDRINAAIGALECAKLELYRRIAAPYEDEKMKDNGDVY